MLLSNLNETIGRRAKTTEELQKLIDISGSVGIEATSARTVKVIDNGVILKNITTPGNLPFKFESSTAGISLKIIVPTLRSYQGMEDLEVDAFIVDVHSKSQSVGPNAITSNKVQTLEGMPNTMLLVLREAPELKSLDGLRIKAGANITLSSCPKIQSLAPAQGATTISISDCENLSFRDFPASCQQLDISDFEVKRGLPWFITIPPSCKVRLRDGNKFHKLDLPEHILNKLLSYREQGKSSKSNLLEIQTLLIDADFDELSEL